MGILYDVTVSHPIILPVITRLSLWHNGMQKYSSTTEYSVCRDFYAVPSPTDERTDMTMLCHGLAGWVETWTRGQNRQVPEVRKLCQQNQRGFWKYLAKHGPRLVQSTRSAHQLIDVRPGAVFSSALCTTQKLLLVAPLCFNCYRNMESFFS